MKRPSGFTPQRDPQEQRPEERGSRGDAANARRTAEITTKTGVDRSVPADAPTGPIPLFSDDRKPGAAGRESTPDETPGLKKASKQRKRAERAEIKRFTVRSRRRRRSILIALAGLAGLAIVALALAYTPIMSVRTIQVDGAVRVSSDAVIADLASVKGSPFPLVDDGAIKAALVKYPLIESYSIEARPPDTLVIRLVERTPVGAIDTGGGFTVVDAAGVVIEASAERPGNYPLIAIDGGTAADGFEPAASVLRALPVELLAQVDTVTATTHDDVSFTLRDSGTQIIWGSAEKSSLKAYTLEKLMAAQPGYGVYDVTSPSVAVVR